MFNVLALKDFIGCLLVSVDVLPDRKSKLVCLQNMLDDESVIRSLREEWLRAKPKLLLLADQLECRSLLSTCLPIKDFNVAGFSIHDWISIFGVDSRMKFGTHIRKILCVHFDLNVNSQNSEGQDNDSMKNALSEIQNSGALQKVMGNAEKIAEDIRNGKKIDIQSMLADIMSDMS